MCSFGSLRKTFILINFIIVSLAKASQPDLPFFLSSQEFIHAKYFLCVDGGGTKTAFEVVDSSGKTLPLLSNEGQPSTEVRGGGSNALTLGIESVQHNIKKALDQIVFRNPDLKLKDIARETVLVAGFAGAASPEIQYQLKEFFKNFGFQEHLIHITSDKDIGIMFLNHRDGAMIISGTGSVAYVSYSGRSKLIGGLGWYLADEGSGFSISKHAVLSVLEADRGYAQKTVLRQKLLEQFQVQEPIKLISLLQNGQIKPSQLAEFSKRVFSAAFNDRDPVAMRVIEQAGSDLACLIQQGVNLLDLNQPLEDDSFPVFLLGGSFQSEWASDFIQIIRNQLNYPSQYRFENIATGNPAARLVRMHLKEQTL